MTKGSASAGRAVIKVRPTSFALARLTWLRSSRRYRHQTSVDSVIASTTPGSRPPVNSAEIETPVTEPMVISTRLGGMGSVWAPGGANSATRAPGLAAEKAHRGPRHAGHLDQKPEEDEQRHRQQDQVAHALVHAADQHQQG